MLAGSPERASAARIPATEPPQAHCLSGLAEQASPLAARQAAGEQAAGVASRIELPGSEHLIGDPARSKGTLHQVNHLFLGHRDRSSPAYQRTRTTTSHRQHNKHP
jgi:hypothetical protein